MSSLPLIKNFPFKELRPNQGKILRDIEDAKSKKFKDILLHDGSIIFGYVDSKNKIVEVAIPIDTVNITNTEVGGCHLKDTSI